MEKGGQLSSTTQPASQHDDVSEMIYEQCKLVTIALINTQKLQCVYYLTQVEPLVTLVAIATIKRRERDNKVTTHITDIATQLRNVHLANLLRPS